MNPIEKKENLPVVKTSSTGPKPIGAVDRPFEEVNMLEMRGHLVDAAILLKRKHGNLFQNDLGKVLKADFKKLATAPNGSHIFIADSDVTIALMKHQNGLLVEIRKPGQPYIRGFVVDKLQLAEAMDLPALTLED